jgi:phosphoglycerate dehydrogenase-like enzyme
MNQPVNVLILTRSPVDPALIDQLQAVSPRLNVQQRDSTSVEGGDDLRGIEVLYTDGRLPQPQQAPDLRWVQGHFAGVNSLTDHPLLRSVTLTTTSGIHAPVLGEYVLMVMLAFAHRLPAMRDYQSRAEWAHGRWGELRPQELRGSTVGIVGYGSIGREVGRLAQAFGMRVLALKRDAGHPADSGFRMPQMGDPGVEHVDRLYLPAALHDLLHESDYVVVAAPLTPETSGMIGPAELVAMKSSAIFINVARGGLVNEPALIEALQKGTIAGAGLDVFAQEPLPADSPLWRMPNVLISPHAAAVNEHYNGRAMALFAENLRRYLAGESLLNVVDVQAGY